MRSFLVYPTFAVYPQLMPTVQLFDTLHRGHDAVMQKKRLKFFWGIFIAIFVWEWFPVCHTLIQIDNDVMIDPLRLFGIGIYRSVSFYFPLYCYRSVVLSFQQDSYRSQHILLSRSEERVGYTNLWYVNFF